jgi:beta-glucosidase
MMKKNEKVLGLIAQMSLDEKLQCLHGQFGDRYRGNQAGFIRGIERLGIPDFFIADGESGVNTSWEATSLPAKVGLAATFDRVSARRYGIVLGKEVRAAGIHLLLTPRVNIVRDYIEATGKNNGGNYQTYGEDPLLNGELGAEEAMGIQTDNNAIANAKQILGSSNGSAQGAGNCIIDMQTLREIYLKPFEPLVKKGVGSTMSNYNQVNGVWTCDLAAVHDEIIRKNWGFKGFVIDDWFCLYDPNSIRHGVTLEMAGNDFYDRGNKYSVYGDQLKNAVQDEKQPVSIEDVDNAVYYYLDTLDRFAMLNEQRIPGAITNEEIKMESAREARLLAGKTAVLLKNQGAVLPVNPESEKIVLIGPGANRQAMPTFKESSYGFRDRMTGTYQVLEEKYGKQISLALGNDLDGEVISSKYLMPERDGNVHGLKRFEGYFQYDTLGNDRLEQIPVSNTYGIDKEVNFTKEHALPVFIKDSVPDKEKMYDFLKDSSYTKEVLKYYMWSGFICPEETGQYRISIQSHIPGVKEFEKNNIQSYESYVLTTGNLYIADEKDSGYKRIGIGTRIFINGGAVPNSEVVPCMDGFNNAGSYVYLEAGKKYGIYFNQCSVYKEPVQIRLAWTTPAMTRAAIDQAAKAAKEADKAIVFAWHKSSSESMTLYGNQNQLIEKVAEVNPNTIVVLNNGDPIEMPWLDKVKGVLEMWFPGQEGALATADVLTGRVNPAGKLPITFPKTIGDSAVRDPKYPERYAEPGRINAQNAVHPNTAVFSEGIMLGYRWFDNQNIEPLFPFGYGLSYTTFSYENMQVKEKNGFEISCLIRNTGACYGEEVVQCYLGIPEKIPDGVQAAEKALADFQRIALKPGEAMELKLTICESSLQYFDKEDSVWKTFPGNRKIMIGSSSRDIRLVQTVFVK